MESHVVAETMSFSYFYFVVAVAVLGQLSFIFIILWWFSEISFEDGRFS